MSALLELAARVEALTGPCRETDAAIAVAVGGFYLAAPRYVGAPSMYGYVDQNGSRVEPGNGAGDGLIPRYTASLDAAMTPVPEGWFTSDYHAGPSGGHWWNLSRIRDGEQRYTSVMGAGKTPALALTAAALRARAGDDR